MNSHEDRTEETEQFKTTRRTCLRAGLAAGVGSALVSAASGGAAAASGYETITIPAGEDRGIVVDGNQVLENKLYDVTADGAGVTFRLKDNATVRNVGIKGSNQSDRFIFRIGGGINEVTIDRVYTECYDPNSSSVGGIVATKNAQGTINVSGATIEGFGNNGLYASKCDADLYVEDCYFVNNRTANFRGGGNFHGNNRDAVFRNCVCVIDEGMENVALYPLGGDRTVGYIARWGEIEVRNCDMWMKWRGSSNWYCLRTDEDKGEPAVKVYDSEIDPKQWTSGDVQYVQNVGSNPTDQPPDYAPTSAEDAASGPTGGDGGDEDDGIAVATNDATDVAETSARLNGDLTDLGGGSSAEVSFEYRRTGADSWTATAIRTRSSTGSFGETVDGLATGVDYEFRAVATGSDGTTATGATATFATDSGLANDLRVDGTAVSEQTGYEITVSGDLAKGDRANDNDTVDGSTADGQVNGGIDTYEFDGEVTDVQLEEDLPIYVNGDRLDLDQFEDSLENELRIDGTAVSEQTGYEITVSGDLAKGDRANDNDTVDGSTADGQVNGGIDTYEFDGEVTDVQLEEDLPIYVNGDRLDLDQFENLPRTITLEGDGSGALYEFTVSGEVEKNPDAGTVDSHDTISGSTVTGIIGANTEGYRFDGEITDYEVRLGGTDSITVYLDGEEVDPASLG